MTVDFAPSARVIADSISRHGVRLTTLEVRMHRFVLAEFNTHRAFSRNSASSRAIPVSKIMRRMTDEPVFPLVWASEQKGMQGGAEVDDTLAARKIWLSARNVAMQYAIQLQELGVHKSIVNRLLEPFMAHTVIVTATDWSNFWTQRCSPLAQPEIRVAADCMRAAYVSSTPRLVEEHDWHTPYLDDEERQSLTRTEALQVSAARCARVSYLTHDGRRDPAVDLLLYDKLVTAQPPHASPLEHVATPVNPDEDFPPGNFYGWRQLRHGVLLGA